MRLSNKILWKRLKSFLKQFRWYGILSNNMKPPLLGVKWHFGAWPNTVSPCIYQALHYLVTLLPKWTLLPSFTLFLTKFREVSIEQLQRVRHAKRIRLLSGHLVLFHMGLACIRILWPSLLNLSCFWTLNLEQSSFLQFALVYSVRLETFLCTDFVKEDEKKRKRKRSDSVLWQKPLHQQKCQKGKVTTQTTPQKSSIKQRLRTDLGRSVGVTTATQLVWLTGLRAHLPTNRNSRLIKRTHI